DARASVRPALQPAVLDQAAGAARAGRVLEHGAERARLARLGGGAAALHRAHALAHLVLWRRREAQADTRDDLVGPHVRVAAPPRRAPGRGWRRRGWSAAGPPRRSPLADTPSAPPSTPRIPPPYPPAFMRPAPPAVPGMAQPNSMPLSDASLARRTIAASEAP